ncbi:MAG: hypothetical protein HC869_20795 [Rhodospirillales bacterium]|nr:hypothetical protein [Rhodospirillales bacterium]
MVRLDSQAPEQRKGAGFEARPSTVRQTSASLRRRAPSLVSKNGNYNTTPTWSPRAGKKVIAFLEYGGDRDRCQVVEKCLHAFKASCRAGPKV